jgi:Kef-type K+ transport system membrane component KefB
MESYKFLLDIALILLTTKLLGLFSRRMKMPQVVGSLAAGLILGPAAFNILQETEMIKQTAELGVIVLMFTAGLETDVAELRKAGKASFIIALIGVILPLLGGLGVAYIFNRGELLQGDTSALLQNIFIGVVLTATSVSITV